MAVTLLMSLIFGFTIIDSVDIGNYANGVAFGHGYVWACENSADNIYKIDPNNMQIVSSFFYAGGLDGLGHDGEYLWIGMHPAYIHKVDTSGNMIGSWPSPGGTYSFGMTFDGQYLWHADKDMQTIYKLDYNDPTNVIQSFNVPWAPYDLAWYRGNLWAVANFADIYELDPSNMNIINSWSTGRPYTSGLALGGGYLWFSNSGGNGKVYKVDGVVKVGEGNTSYAKLNRLNLNIYPNPSKDFVKLALSTPKEKNVSIKIYDSAGRLIRKLFSGKVISINVIWDGKDDFDMYVNPGIYLVRVETKNSAVLKKIIFLGK